MPALDAPPALLTAGDTWRFRWESPAYPPAAGWVVAWRVIGPGVNLAFSSAADGAGFLATAAAVQTAALAVPAQGLPCMLIGQASLSGVREEIWRAPLQLRPDPATITGDLRGHAARVLAALEAMLEGKATKDQESYKLGDRELKRMPIAELLKWRDYYKTEAAREAKANGLGRPRQVITRMVRA